MNAAAPPNVNARLRSYPTLKEWVLAGCMALLVLLSIEMLWRYAGWQPAITEDHALWALQRERVETAGPETMVILGRSRILQAFVPSVFHDVLPDWHYVQLGVNAAHPLCVLRDIAENTAFAGVVLIETDVPTLFPEVWEQQQAYVDYYHTQWNPLTKLARQTDTLLQSRLALLLPELPLHRALPNLLRGRLNPQYVLRTADRVYEADYRKVDLDEHLQTRLDSMEAAYAHYMSLPGFRQWPEGLETVEGWVRSVQERGGRVVFFFPILTGIYGQRDEELLPRKKYWDVFAAQTSAETVYCKDLPGMRDLRCADGSHLFREHCPVFTRVLTQELVRRGICR